MAVAEGVVAGGVPVYEALAGSAVELRVSPLLGPLDVWGRARSGCWRGRRWRRSTPATCGATWRRRPTTGLEWIRR